MLISVDFTATVSFHDLFKLRLGESSVAIDYSIDNV